MKLHDILKVASRAGIEYLGISDHIKASTDISFLADLRNEIKSIRTKMHVFLGCEADILNVGKHTVTESMKSDLDYIAVSANHFHTETVASPPDNSNESVAKHFMDMFKYACTLNFADTIVHPLFVFRNTYDPVFLKLISDDNLTEALQSAKNNKIAMEISPKVLEPNQLDFRLKFYSMCKQIGVKFTIGSDSHSLASIGQTHLLGSMLRALDINDDDIWLPCKKSVK